MDPVPLRLLRGVDLRAALEAELVARLHCAAFVISAVGSLEAARLRLAGAVEPTRYSGDLEILTLAGTVAVNESHLHMSISDSNGRVTGGHVAQGCLVRTTAEVLLLLLPEWSFNRELGRATGFADLVLSRRGAHADWI